MQSDGGFVQYVHHADQAGANLAGQADALRLAARERVGAAIERQVVESDIDQKAEPFTDLAADFGCNLAATTGQLHVGEELLCAADGHRRELR